MTSEKNGEKEYKVRVIDVTMDGVGIELGEKKYFLSYELFPWIQYLTPPELAEMTSRYGDDLYVPSFGLEFELDYLEHPEKYPHSMDPIMDELPELPRKRIFELPMITKDGRVYVVNDSGKLVDITDIRDQKEA